MSHILWLKVGKAEKKDFLLNRYIEMETGVSFCHIKHWHTAPLPACWAVLWLIPRWMRCCYLSFIYIWNVSHPLCTVLSSFYFAFSSRSVLMTWKGTGCYIVIVAKCNLVHFWNYCKTHSFWLIVGVSNKAFFHLPFRYLHLKVE